MEQKYIDIEELSELLHISTSTINRWVKKRAVPTYKLGSRRLFNKEEILKWMSEKKEF
jgi:excisionase family DNA binding protein